MDLDNGNAQRVTKYLNGKLAGKEKRIFEQELKINIALQKELQLQEKANKLIEVHFTRQNEKALWESYQSLTAKMPPFREQVNEREIEKSVSTSGPKISFWKRKITLAAASLLILGAFGFGILFSENSVTMAKTAMKLSQSGSAERSSDLANDQANSISQLIIVISKDNRLSDKLSLSFLYLERGEYEKAIPVLLEAKQHAQKDQNPIQDSIQWDLATAYLGAKKYDEAIAAYETILKNAQLKEALLKKAKSNLRTLKIKQTLRLQN